MEYRHFGHPKTKVFNTIKSQMLLMENFLNILREKKSKWKAKKKHYPFHDTQDVKN